MKCDNRVVLGQGQVEQAQELTEGGLIHHVHHTHLRNQEVQDAASRRNYRRSPI